MPGVSFRVNPDYTRISEVVPGLFICGVTELNAETVAKHNITHIINATTEVISTEVPFIGLIDFEGTVSFRVHIKYISCVSNKLEIIYAELQCKENVTVSDFSLRQFSYQEIPYPVPDFENLSNFAGRNF